MAAMFLSEFSLRRCNGAFERVCVNCGGGCRAQEQLVPSFPSTGGFVFLIRCCFCTILRWVDGDCENSISCYESQFPTRRGHISQKKPGYRSWMASAATLHADGPTQVSQCFE